MNTKNGVEKSSSTPFSIDPFCPQTRPDAQFEQMIHGTAFEKTGFHVSKLKKYRTKPVANRPHCPAPIPKEKRDFFSKLRFIHTASP